MKSQKNWISPKLKKKSAALLCVFYLKCSKTDAADAAASAASCGTAASDLRQPMNLIYFSSN